MNYQIRIESRAGEMESTVEITGETPEGIIAVMSAHAEAAAPVTVQNAVVEDDATRYSVEELTELNAEQSETIASLRAKLARQISQGVSASDLSACREAAEGLRAQRDNALAEVERLGNILLSKDVTIEALKGHTNTMFREKMEALAEVERLKSCLLTPEEAKEIAETYRDFVKVVAPADLERPSFYEPELAAIRRATRPA